MYISTRGRYAIRLMLDLAEHNDGGYVSKSEISKRQEIPLKYLERILGILATRGLIISAAGRNGGYRLERSPDSYSIWEILNIMETTLSPVSCLHKKSCARTAVCLTLPLWKKFEEIAASFFNAVTLADLLDSSQEYLDGVFLARRKTAAGVNIIPPA